MYADISAQIGLLAEKNFNDIYCDTNRIILPGVRRQKTSSIVKKSEEFGILSRNLGRHQSHRPPRVSPAFSYLKLFVKQN